MFMPHESNGFSLSCLLRRRKSSSQRFFSTLRLLRVHIIVMNVQIVVKANGAPQPMNFMLVRGYEGLEDIVIYLCRTLFLGE